MLVRVTTRYRSFERVDWDHAGDCWACGRRVVLYIELFDVATGTRCFGGHWGCCVDEFLTHQPGYSDRRYTRVRPS